MTRFLYVDGSTSENSGGQSPKEIEERCSSVPGLKTLMNGKRFKGVMVR